MTKKLLLIPISVLFILMSACGGGGDNQTAMVKPSVLAVSNTTINCGMTPTTAAADQSIVGTVNNDVLNSTQGNDTIDGLGGLNMVVYQCSRSNYTITKTTNGWTVTSAAEGTDTLANIQRLQFANQIIALDLDGNAGMAYRIYQAAFNRAPDNEGLKFWIAQLDNGASYQSVAAGFISSAEFQSLYGKNPSSGDFITKLYSNVLHRAPDPAGYAWWLNVLNTNQITQVGALMGFSESAENKSGVSAAIGTGVITTTTGCSVPSYKYGEVQFPIEYLNTTTLTINNSTQRLPNSVNRALATKDDWPSRGGPWAFKPDSGCNNQSTYAYNLWKETLTRIASAGADRVYIYNRGDWDDLTKSVWTGVNQAVSNEELKFIVDEATKRKLKVYYIWQLADYDITPNHNHIPTSDEYNTLSLVDLTKLMNAWHKLLLEQATYANKIGISGMSVDITLNTFISSENREYWVTKTVDIINDVRKIYVGELIYGAGRSRVPNEHLTVNILDHRIVSKVDAVMIPLAIDMSNVIQHDSASYKNLTMQFLKEAKTDIDKQLNGVPLNVPVIFAGYKTSTNENKDIEDSFCVADYSWTSTTVQLECIQRSILSNFHKQANAIQGIFEALISQLYFTNNYTIVIDGYWFTDDLTPSNDISTGFPNLSRSIRNKPAENIVKNWFAKG